MTIQNSINAPLPIAIAKGGTGQTTVVGAFDALAPTTTKGDTVAHTGVDNIRIPVGADGQVITADSTQAGGLKWANAGAGTVTGVTGTANRITSSGGAAPAIDIAATYVGQASLTTLGTVATGVWNGTAVDIAHGGTGQATANAAFNALSPNTTKGDITAYGTGANVRVPAGANGTVLSADSTQAGGVAWIAAGGVGTVTSVSGTAGRITVATGTTTPVINLDPAYVGQASITTTGALSSGSLAAGFTSVTVPLGGTGLATMTTPYAVVCSGTTATGNLQPLAALGALGTVLTSNGAASLPSFQALPAAGSWIKIGTSTAAGSASISFTGLNSTYSAYAVQVTGLVPATNNSQLYMRTSANNGTSYDSTGGNYQWIGVGAWNGTTYNRGNVSDGAINFTNMTTGATGISSTASLQSLNGWVYLFNPAGTANYFTCQYSMSFASSATAGTTVTLTGTGYRASAAAVNAVQFLMDSGNITTGKFTLYGIVA